MLPPQQFRFAGKEVQVQRFFRGVLLLPAEGTRAPLVVATHKFSANFMSARDKGGPQTRANPFR